MDALISFLLTFPGLLSLFVFIHFVYMVFLEIVDYGVFYACVCKLDYEYDCTLSGCENERRKTLFKENFWKLRRNHQYYSSFWKIANLVIYELLLIGAIISLGQISWGFYLGFILVLYPQIIIAALSISATIFHWMIIFPLHIALLLIIYPFHCLLRTTRENNS